MRLLLLALLLLPGAARAQSCGLAWGAAGGVSPAGRDWDLSTPGPIATSASPVLSAQCSGAGAWVSVDTSPWLRHSWRRLHARGPQLVSARMGAAEGLYLVTNGPAWGLGVHGRIERVVELRAEWIGGANPDFQGWVLLHADPVALDRERRIPGLEGGLEVGRMIGYRVEIRPAADGPELGLRIGALTWLRSGTAVQPLALWALDVPIAESVELSVSAGPTLRAGAVEPIGGLAVQVEADRGPELHAGVLVGVGARVYATPDVGMAFVW